MISVITVLQLTLEWHDNDSGVQTVKSTLFSDIKDRFASMYEQPLLVVATVVNPRYKLKFFSEVLQKGATELLIAKVRCITVPATNGNDELPPMMKWPHMEAASKLSGVTHEIVSCGVQTGGPRRLYLAQPNIPLSKSLTAWWRDNARLCPQVAGVARHFLSTAATSVPRECNQARVRGSMEPSAA